ncbi:glycosyltransferase family 2 protein [Mesorhizobium sp. M0633]|uniref:glycosyltransferase family 2 protein n=1 Tax=Mesorhizobium sp. M0633 TaxID=2956977 RepID=UPI00333B80C2
MMLQDDAAARGGNFGDDKQSRTAGSPLTQLPVTVVIPVKNEEHNLPRCLEKLGRFAQIVVVDSDSSDCTREIAATFNARVLEFKWDGHYPKKRNWVLLNYNFETPWVLFLDADEYLDAQFCDALIRALDDPAVVGFWLTYTNHFLGRELRYGVPQRKLSLFRVGAGVYERIEESNWSSLDMEVHEHPVLKGAIGEIRIPINHEDYNGLGKFLTKHVQYAKWEARRYFEIALAEPEKFTRRQRLKYKYITRWWFSWSYFVYSYVFRLGFMDGQAGFMYAFYKLWYFLSIRRMIYELESEVVKE